MVHPALSINASEPKLPKEFTGLQTANGDDVGDGVGDGVGNGVGSVVGSAVGEVVGSVDSVFAQYCRLSPPPSPSRGVFAGYNLHASDPLVVV